MLIVGIDPHKNTHTAVAFDSATGQVLGEITIDSTSTGYRSLRAWLETLAPDLIAVENVRGLGHHLAVWLQHHGYTIMDVTTKEVRAQRLARRSGRNKNDSSDALGAAIAAATGSGYRLISDADGLAADLLTEEREALNAEYTGKRNRLHALMRALRPGGASTGASLEEFSDLLKGIRDTTKVIAETKRQARQLLAQLRRLTTELTHNQKRTNNLADQSQTSLTTIDGVGVVTAAAILGAIGDINRFTSHHHLAAFAGAAPKQIASGNNNRHRLDRNGNRRLRRAIHVAAMTQARMTHGPGRTYYLKKRDEGKTHREALRCLKRQLIKTIWRTMRHDTDRKKLLSLAA